MKQLVRILCSLFIIASITSCNNETQPQHETKIIKLEQDGFILDLATNSNKITTKGDTASDEQYIMTVSKDEKALQAIIVKENFSDENFDLHHYTTDQVLIATINIRDNKVVDIELNNDRPFQTKGYVDCVGDEYSNYKEFYSRGDAYEMICDLANIFGGACTVAGALIAGVSCLLQ